MTVEDWTEPWLWRPSDWPNQPLALNVVGNAHPPRGTSPGNQFTPLYSFNGSSPGPTIRLRGTERLRVTVRNHLGPNLSRVPKGPAPDPFEVRPDVLDAAFCRMQKDAGIRVRRRRMREPSSVTSTSSSRAVRSSWSSTSCLSGHVNVPHGSHTTNLHTHGLHVEPGFNANGTSGDNTFLRILPHADGQLRKTSSDPSCRTLGPHERIGEAQYEHQFGNVQKSLRRPAAAAQPAPPGHALVPPARPMGPRRIKSRAASLVSSLSKGTSTT